MRITILDQDDVALWDGADDLENRLGTQRITWFQRYDLQQILFVVI